MITGLDHIVVLLDRLDAGMAAYTSLFGRAPAWRGTHDGASTALFTLDNMTLELMAPDGDGPTADRIRAVLAADGPGLASICFRTDDIAKMHRKLQRVALQPDNVSEVERRDSVTGATLAWRRTRGATATTRGVRLFFLQLAAERPLSPVVAEAGIVGLDHVVIATADPERAAALYGARLGLDMALDRKHPEWGQLIFFRCGDLIVELVHRPDTSADSARDRLWGLSWRVTDVDATQARLIAAGIEVSDVRAGRKPGTRVASLRSGTCGIPTLLVERAPRPD